MAPPTNFQQSADNLKIGKVREDLQLLKGAPTIVGKPTWLIFDPVQHRYFEIDFEVFELLSLWNRFETSQQLIEAAWREQSRKLSMSRIQDIMRFLDQNNLIMEAGDGNWRIYHNREERKKVSAFTWLIHNYLFVKVPLVRPSRFLKAAYPYVAFLFTRTMLWLMIAVGVTGLYLVSRQWDAFMSTFADFMTFEGAITYAITLIFVKILHELGHAFMAVRFGCRVPTMGVAFLVMFPVLYTDVTDAWKLRARRQRLLIGGAGLLVELSLAAMATVLWVFLPDGTLKSLAFVVATISWIMSVAVNLNPFMRFDGYYLLSDGLGMSNLQSRSFAFGRWKLREVLFDLGAPPPEALPAATVRILTLYAWGVWVYRFFLFIGIAVLVYAYFFKALGVLLFCIEIIWFIARPFWSEVKEWPAMRKQIFRRARVYMSLSVAAVATALVVLPVSGRVDVPVVVEPANFERVFPPIAARLDEILVAANTDVKKGQLLFRFSSSELKQKISLTKIKIDLIKARIARVNVDDVDKTQYLPLQQELASLRAEMAGLLAEQKQLSVRAPISGRAQDLNLKLHKGRWVKASDRLVTIANGSGYVARGYVLERDLWRITKGDKGTYIPDDFLVSETAVNVRDISLASAHRLELKPLASVFGGKIASRRADNQEIVPVSAAYQVTLGFDGTPQDVGKVSRGIARLDGVPESIAAQIWRRVLQVLVRESGA